MNYSNDPAKTRIDFFRPNGKWSTTDVLDWSGAYQEPLWEAYPRLLVEQFPDIVRQKYDGKGYLAVCLEPYHQYAHPLMIDCSHIPMIRSAQSTSELPEETWRP